MDLQVLEPALPYFVFVFGAIWGSFANVVILRWPAGESFIAPRSRCPHCKTALKWYHNIPIFSWLVLRGKCAFCQGKISVRYPIVEFVMAALFLAVYLKVGMQWVLVEYLIFVFGLVTVSVIDLDHFLLPDLFTLSGIVIGILGSLLNPERSFADSLIGVFLGGGFLWAIAYLYYVFRKQEGMGGGDIKLLAWIGAVLGWKSVPFVIMSSSLIGTLAGLVVAYRQKKGLKTVIPFGPYLALGAILYILAGQSLGALYISLFIPALENTN